MVSGRLKFRVALLLIAPRLSYGVEASSSALPSSYQLIDDFSGPSFFENFDFFSEADPTNGYVKYVDISTANATGLAGYISTSGVQNISSKAVFLGVDSANATATGRNSVRIHSKEKYNQALVVADILHMPAPVCGSWPAFWMLGSAGVWPSAGEIDIIEGVNDAQTNRYSLHTTAGIRIDANSSLPGDTGKGMKINLETYDCDINAAGQDHNVGCTGVDLNGTRSFGDDFNHNLGGIFATLVDTNGIRIWFFDRQSVPQDILEGSPNPPNTSKNGTAISPSTWGQPNVRFTGPSSAAFEEHFKDMQIIFNIAFCGDWAGKVWSQNPTCSKLAPTCEQYVAENPQAFAEVYWAVQSVKIYQVKPMSGPLGL